MGYFKKHHKSKKKCPDCDWGNLSVNEYTDGEFLYDCHSCGYVKELSKRETNNLLKSTPSPYNRGG